MSRSDFYYRLNRCKKRSQKDFAKRSPLRTRNFGTTPALSELRDFLFDEGPGSSQLQSRSQRMWGKPMRGIWMTAILLGLLGPCIHVVQAQDLAESAAMTSKSSISAQISKPPSLASASPAKQNPSPHLAAQLGPPMNEVNRQSFEDNAGEKAGKLLLRSVPSGALIFINDLCIGQTPMLMMISPGKYKIDMLGPRQESGHSKVGVMPKETQTVLITLNQRYPASIALRRAGQ